MIQTRAAIALSHRTEPMRWFTGGLDNRPVKLGHRLRSIHKKAPGDGRGGGRAHARHRGASGGHGAAGDASEREDAHCVGCSK